MTFALLCIVAQGAWAQTPSGNWTDNGNYSESWTTSTDGKTVYINSEADLARLAYVINSNVESGSGKTYVLTADLDMSAHYWIPIGNATYEFMGTFDGQGHTISGINVNRSDVMYNGLFGFAKTPDFDEGYQTQSIGIRNLKLKSSTINGGSFTGGIVGQASGTVYIQNIICNATVTGNDYVGGIVGYIVTPKNVNSEPKISGCLYNGNSVIATEEGSHDGYIVGWEDIIKDMPTYFQNNLNTKSRTDDDYSKRAYALTVSGLSDNVKMNWVDTEGIADDNTLYVPNDAKMRMGPYCDNGEGNMPNKSITAVKINGTALNLSADCLYRYTFNGTEDGTLEVVSENLYTVGHGTESEPYEIDNPARWNAFAMSVTNGGNNFAGKFFKLTDDVNASTMVGMSTHPFSGNFRGGLGNYTLTLNYGTASEPFNEEYCAPFRYVSGATIRHLMVGGEIYTSNKYAAGIVGKVIGNSDIIGCRSSVAINSSVNGDGNHGGLVGELGSAELNITGCRFDGRILGSTTSSCGGFLGSGDPTDATLTLTGCLFDPTEITVSGGRTLANTTGTLNISNCYYHTTMGEVQGAKPIKLINRPANLGGTSDEWNFSASGFKVWDNAIQFNYRSTDTQDPYYYVTSVGLHDDTSNDDLLAELEYNTDDNNIVSVTLSGRTFYRDGSWNTLCLPFNMSTAELEAQKTTEGSVFYGAELMALDYNSSFSSGELTINFSPSGEIEAGKPYIVRWTNSGSDIVNPVFNDVKITKLEPTTTESEHIDFVGTFNPVGIYEPGDVKTNLYLGADNTLYYPEDDSYTTASSFKVNAFRGYFKLKNGLTAGEPADPVRSFVLNFGDETDGISDAVANSSSFTLHSSFQGWYTLDGRQLSGKPTQKGIYVNNGKKVAIK